MKKFLKSVLPARQYERLKIIKGKIYSLPDNLISFIIKALPAKLKIKIKSNCIVLKKMDYQLFDILLNVDSDIEYEIRASSCKKEPETIEWIQSFFKAGEVFYDIGANIGAYSLVASRFFKGNISVYAFEPSFISFSQLCRNILINNCYESITPLQIALSDKTNVDTFNYENCTPGGAFHTLGNPIDFTGDVFKPVFKQKVLSYRLDDLIKQFHIPIPNHIKIDVDGIELEILYGAQDILQNSLLRSVFLEINEIDKERADKIINSLLLKEFKFKSKHKSIDLGETGPYSRTYNYIFKR